MFWYLSLSYWCLSFCLNWSLLFHFPRQSETGRYTYLPFMCILSGVFRCSQYTRSVVLLCRLVFGTFEHSSQMRALMSLCCMLQLYHCDNWDISGHIRRNALHALLEPEWQTHVFARTWMLLLGGCCWFGSVHYAREQVLSLCCVCCCSEWSRDVSARLHKKQKKRQGNRKQAWWKYIHISYICASL
jgi:hypothetical protein